jgi:hypothetical protein
MLPTPGYRTRITVPGGASDNPRARGEPQKRYRVCRYRSVSTLSSYLSSVHMSANPKSGDSGWKGGISDTRPWSAFLKSEGWLWISSELRRSGSSVACRDAF